MTEHELWKQALQTSLPDKDDIRRQVLQAAPAPKKHRKAPWIAATACVACAALIVTLCSPMMAWLYGKTPETDLAVKQINTLHNQFDSYSEIYKQLEASERLRQRDTYYYSDESLGFNTMVTEDSASDNFGYSGGTSAPFSDTNEQVADVHEGDIVKTDGSYIYTADGDGSLYILRADNGAVTTVSKTTVDSSVNELYVSGDRLVLMQDDSYGDGASYQSATAVAVYDIADRTAPVLLDTFRQSGYYNTSRLIDNTVYACSIAYMQDSPDEKQPETYVPCIDDNPIPPQQVACRDCDDYQLSYSVIRAIDIQNATSLCEKALTGFSDTLYANTENLYLCSSAYRTDENNIYTNTYTDIIRLSLTDGHLTLTASGSVEGTMLNQFCMDEYNGVLRVAVTVNHWNILTNENETVMTRENQQYCSLYTLDSSLQPIGQIKRLAEDESVQSVRFMGDVGYVVTFRQTDPLFAIDLSDPAVPKILSALKIPGFSSYLHPFGDGLLLGIGNDADTETGRTQDAKLSMFDASDLSNVTETSSLLLDSISHTGVSCSHKALFCDVQRGLIGFTAESSYINGIETIDYRVYRYADGQFTNLLTVPLHTVNWNEIYNSDTAYDDYPARSAMWNTRGLYIGDYFYLVTPTAVYSYNYADFSPVSTLTL